MDKSTKCRFCLTLLLKLLTVKDLKDLSHFLNSHPLGGRGRHIYEFEASLVYRASSWTAKATQEKPSGEKHNKQKGKPTKTTIKRVLTFQSVNISWIKN